MCCNIEMTKKYASYHGYDSCYDYTVYDMGFIFNNDDDEDFNEFLNRNYISPSNFADTGGNINH